MEFNLSAGLFSAEHHFEPLEEARTYDVLILGGGPAGMTAAVYCMRKGLSTGLITGNVGVQMADTAGIENYLGYRYIQGNELIDKFREQVTQFGISFETDAQIVRMEPGRIHRIHLADGRTFTGRTIIIATGKQSKKLQVPGEREFTGHGVAYCAICDAPFYAGRSVVVVGGGNSGVAAGIDLAKIAEHVTLIQRRDRLTADQILIDKLAEFKNVNYLLEHEIKTILGEKQVKRVELVSRKNGRKSMIDTDGVFVEIGLVPNSAFARDVVAMNEYAEIIVDCHCRTSVDGLFAAGDVTSVPYKQIIIACGEGAKAALSAADYIMNQTSQD
ncbi:MAG: FAD-dependent oxidoreductase [Ruminococcaceae bacterium]|nr:FAD-dependent oxidoreductase [Oscillospiraceae bacterium]